MNKAKSFFDLAGVRQYEVQIDNGFLTVSIVACFIGLVMIIASSLNRGCPPLPRTTEKHIEL